MAEESFEGPPTGLRSLRGYEAVKQAFVNTASNLGERFSTEVTTLEELYSELSEAHNIVMAECRSLYNLDNTALLGLKDAIIREAFNSRSNNRFGVRELDISRVKAVATGAIMTQDSHASFGIGNIKAFRIDRDVYNALPADYRDHLGFDEDNGHVDTKNLAVFLNPRYLPLAYERMSIFYSAVFASRSKFIDEKCTEHGFEDWQKRYIVSVMMCCTDPVPRDKSVDDMPYDNAYRLLLDPVYAREHFAESKDAIIARQDLSYRFFF
jgi:hypothetical protein